MKKHGSTILLLLVFFIGLSVLLYPTISNYWNSRTQTQAITNYESLCQTMTVKDYTEEFTKAEEYNEKIRHISYPLMNYAQVKGYDTLLNPSETGMMGYLSIPRINVELPIYHGTSDSVLGFAAGHVKGTSLPIGGKSTHAVLSGHRGLPSARLFTDLNELEVGDQFTITILDRVLTYEVDQISIVYPDEVDGLRVIDGKDYCTLVTCTPYGINTHRILVRGKRVDTITPKPKVYVPNDANIIDPMVVMPILATPMLLVLLILLLIKYRKKK